MTYLIEPKSDWQFLFAAQESEPNRGRSNHAACRAYDEFAPGILANAASRCTESSLSISVFSVVYFNKNVANWRAAQQI